MKSKKLSENILKLIKSEGFRYINLDTVIETNHIVERSGESFRRFIFSFNDQKGNEICLRPDLTIASCLKYLNEKNKASKKVFYSGQAFRKTQKISDNIINWSSSLISPIAIPATGFFMGTPASINDKLVPQTDAIELEPFDSVISDTTLIT